MNDFEKTICQQYGECALDLLKEASQTAVQLSDAVDPGTVRENEMQVAAMYRVVYLALKEYHRTLSAHLASNGISLPDFDELVSK